MVRIIIFFAFFLVGCDQICKVDPVNPPFETLDHSVEDISCDDPIFQKDTLLPDEWWLIFEDAQLNELIEQALCQNPNLQLALNRVYAAQAVADRMKSSLFPYISYGADVSRQKLSETGVIPFQTGPKGSGTPAIDVPIRQGGLIPVYFTLYETEINLKYEFDFWGKNRNRYRAALGKVQAELIEMVYAKLQLSIAVARTYFRLQVNFEREKNLMRLVNNRKAFLELVKQRVERNIENELTVQTAEFNLIDTQDQLLGVQGEIAINNYQLMALVAGNFDEDITDICIRNKNLPRIPIPHDIPLHLIANRPDIAAQLKLIGSAGSLIEVAKAGFYPDFNLYAFFGYQTIHFPELFKWDSSFFNIDPAVTLPIFDGGRLYSELRKSEIDYNGAILEYNQLIIDAAKEVLQALALSRNSWQRLTEYKSKVEHQRKYNQLISLRVEHNIGNALDKFTSEGSVLISLDQELIALSRTYMSLLDLVNALGGGYQSD